MIFLTQAPEAAQVVADPKWWAQPGATLLGGALVFAAAWVAFAAQALTRKQEKTHHAERLTEEEKARTELVEAQREEWQARIAQEGEHHKERLEKERLALLDTRLSQREEWVARNRHEREQHLERLREEARARAEMLAAQRDEWEARIDHERKEARRSELLRLYSDMLALTNYANGWVNSDFSSDYRAKISDDLRTDLSTILAPPEVSKRFYDFVDAFIEKNAEKTRKAISELRVSIREHIESFG